MSITLYRLAERRCFEKEKMVVNGSSPYPGIV